MRGNSASNHKTDAWLKIKILLAVVTGNRLSETSSIAQYDVEPFSRVITTDLLPHVDF